MGFLVEQDCPLSPHVAFHDSLAHMDLPLGTLREEPLPPQAHPAELCSVLPWGLLAVTPFSGGLPWRGVVVVDSHA